MSKTSPHFMNALLQRMYESNDTLLASSYGHITIMPTSYAGNKYVLVVADYLTRYPEAICLPDQKAATITKAFICNIVARYGIPQYLLADRNSISKLMKEVCELLCVKKIETTAYHPAANGLVERLNRTLLDTFSQYYEKDLKTWNEQISLLLLTYRSAENESYQECPFFLLLGRDVMLPMQYILAPRKVNYAVNYDYKAELI
ncbi:uncharacterized protein LOC106471894 [Limulus polyphemus]|uniref:Uncharacterized protein LOC106471894 n=1 Tax=Limulus polyphemus TaxID=6850 RepID=A0ABM1BST5_LIMPO|nr:uncharacterized protein LOC106471894 [Limulus polyphemus]